MSFGRAFRIVAVVLGVVTVVLGVICVVNVVQTRAFLDQSVRASGEVIELIPRRSCEEDEDGDRRCSLAYAPRVRFVTADGREIDFVSGTAANPPNYAEGDAVDVRYRPDDPSGAQIDRVTEVWLAVIVTGALTVFFAAMCAVWIVLAVRFRAH